MKSIIRTTGLIILAAFLTGQLNAQQDPFTTQYMFNPMSVNPSFTASGEDITVTALSRQQWIGFEGAPSTQYISGLYPVEKLNFNLGGTLIHDKAGPETQTSLHLDYGYRVKINEQSRMDFGIRSGFGFYRADIVNLAMVSDYDPSFITDIRKKVMLNFGIGATYVTDKYYIGYSVPRIIRNKMDSEDNSVRYSRHHYLYSGARFSVNQDIDLYPSLMSKFVEGAPPSVDITVNALYQKTIGAGLMYRIGASIGAMVSYQVRDNICVGYSYDMAITRIHYQSFGTHEFMITYNFGKGFISNLDRRFVRSAGL